MDTVELAKGVDLFTRLELRRKAAAFKGVTLIGESETATSGPIKEYELDEAVLAALAERGIRRHLRPDPVFTLADENPQVETPGWIPSNYWNFELKEGGSGIFDLRISLHLGFNIATGSRGIVCLPVAEGTMVSPTDRLPNFRMFKALTEIDADAPAVAKAVAASDGFVIIAWDELGLGGILPLAHLFSIFTNRNDAIRKLGADPDIFNPVPLPQYPHSGHELYIAEPVQQRVVQAWRAQLEAYRARLVA